MGSESSGFEQASCDVVREVPEAERGAAEVLSSYDLIEAALATARGESTAAPAAAVAPES